MDVKLSYASFIMYTISNTRFEKDSISLNEVIA